MSLNKYQVFIKVAETLNLTRAADELNYTQPAISHIIKSLEKEVGLQLIVRGKAGVHLTSYGERLLENARQIVKCESDFMQKAGMMRGIEVGGITVGTFPRTSIQLMPDILCEMHRRYPNVTVIQQHGRYWDVEQLLTEDRVDCGFLTDKRGEQWDFVPLLRDEFLLVLPQGHRLCACERVPREELNGEQFITLNESGYYYETGSLLSGVSTSITNYVQDDFIAIPLVERGMGITLTARLVLDCMSTTAVLKRFVTPRYRTIGVAVKSMASAPPLTKLFIDMLREYVSAKYQSSMPEGFDSPLPDTSLPTGVNPFHSDEEEQA